jgi:2-polyprenyl-6-methoxyphenol hydroxylase-like FAD-dependent oxidoreductase
MGRGRVLISGGGIAGLTLGILLKQKGWEPVVVERDTALSAKGYMMDFFRAGWDVAAHMGLVEALRAVRYPINALEFVDATGRVYISVPIDRVRRALDDKYVYLTRSDLVRILYTRARQSSVEVRFGMAIAALEDRGPDLQVAFADGSHDTFALVFGADGIHSRVRELVFGTEDRFAHFLGYYAAAFHLADHGYMIGHSIKLYEEPDRIVFVYPLGDGLLTATYIFRHPDVGMIRAEQKHSLVEHQYSSAGWIAERALRDHPSSEPIYFDSMTQIIMPTWHRGRIALLGDACGCLTLAAGQGANMAMAGAYILANELERQAGNHGTAFAAYEAFMKPRVTKRQRDAAALSRLFVPTQHSWPSLRRAVTRFLLSGLAVRYALRYFGSQSFLPAIADKRTGRGPTLG